MNRKSSINIVTRLRTGRPGCDSRERQGFFSSRPRSDSLWVPRSLVSSAYRGQSGRGVKLITYLNLVELYLSLTNTSSWRGT